MNPEKSRLFEVSVNNENSGERIDRFLSEHPEVLSRSRASKLIERGHVKVNGIDVKPSYKLNSGDVIEVIIPETKSSPLEPLHEKIDIRFEDESVIVLHKPAGLVVHPATSHQNDTLVNMLLAHTKDLSVGFDHARPGIVHRLDRDTSGLLVVAKTDAAHIHLSESI